jgi:hypothetical protein
MIAEARMRMMKQGSQARRTLLKAHIHYWSHHVSRTVVKTLVVRGQTH